MPQVNSQLLAHTFGYKSQQLKRFIIGFFIIMYTEIYF